MSGGHFDYAQFQIATIADKVELLIESNNDATQDGYGYTVGRFYSAEVIAHFKDGLAALRKAEVYAQRIDWLVSDDDGEDRFIERLAIDLSELE